MRTISGMFTASSFLFLFFFTPFFNFSGAFHFLLFTLCFVGSLCRSIIPEFAYNLCSRPGGRTDGPPNRTEKRSGGLNSSNPSF